MGPKRLASGFASFLFLIFGRATLQAQTPSGSARAKGSEDKAVFLVAHPDLGDPMFRQSVVLLFPAAAGAAEAEGLIVGVIVNKATKVSLAQIFPNEKSLKNRTEILYFGGPVNPQAVSIVFRSAKAANAKQAIPLIGDVYASFDGDYIKQILKKPNQARDVRLFLGRSQWAPEQLQHEMLTGAWFNLRAESQLIFSAQPEFLWQTLRERADPSPVAELAGRAQVLTAWVRKGGP